ncbi:MAG: GNAT family N-acetyltransferase [Chloroflexota bacterium]|nr:GNAT family N-acetyltransferase [Chloroflexota bacterium]
MACPDEAHSIEYRETAEGLEASQLAGFFVDWLRQPTPEAHLDILHGSGHVVVALDEQSDQVVGFVTAISDGVLSAYISLLEVLPEYQGRGIGSELMRRLLEQTEGLYMVDVLCDAHVQSYYARFGMQRSVGMCIRRYDRIPSGETGG